MARQRHALTLLAGLAVMVPACAVDRPAPTATEPPPFVGELGELLAEPQVHVGALVDVSGIVGQVAEGGPMFTLRDGSDGEVVVLIDPPDDQYSIDYVPGQAVEVTGVLLEFTAENVDSADSPYLEGEAVMRYWAGPRYMIISEAGPST